MADLKDDLTEKAHFDPNWIQWNGGSLHSNNVLFYFATSPFFDHVSGNQSLFTQWAGTPNQNDILGTRAKFEANLRHQRGIQYVVEHDPLEEQVVLDGPNGPEKSNVWVIRKQNRETERDDSITVLGYYYIVNNVIYQAPSVASVLNYRLLNTVSALNKVFTAPADLSFFSVSHGHTYHKPVQESATQNILSASQQGNEPAPPPTPGPQPSTTEKAVNTSQAQEETNGGTRTAWDALRMTLQYGKEYVDDMPLVGEPGNFRFSKSKDASVTASQTKGQSQTSPTGTPGQSRATSVVPPTSSNPPAAGKGSKLLEKTAPLPEGAAKAKRRKSKPGVPSP
ncbi:uncharacterized protein Z520_07511 [Fonsecaea multimorphosa CBS 102226]|uniref:Mediator of RNA polymerase II transcription subunit 6 n=1 Tax=Fonsecaea multimorphosa CBS 102226 TaxID=1442371 RepID=A0A0D2IID2_9EURO|nr:uncharacterized protein Z520_07511 [Fonsecaea multimorphosa CBS 102226]KIX96791.1 hypothetical protein Z520_07511 [Fonsecaea multimorphosa CBS 102226]OAL22472.1 hypothetical protein AYO22_07030 [Fonsecaea multimorphosa]